MSFTAAIHGTQNLSAWTRALLALAGVSDQIRVAVSKSTVLLQAVNASRTTHGEIEFPTAFFEDYAFHTSSILPEGYHADGDRSSYSLLVALKHVAMLFRSLDPASVDYVCLRVDCSTATPALRRYKLHVEMLTKKLVLKKYQMNYSPVEHHQTPIPQLYKHDDSVRFFRIDTSVFKLFLDMVPVATEDFSITVKPHKINFGAYTRQIVKDRELLKQPMLIVILMDTGELCESNMAGVEDTVNFRLKDFRIFVNLALAMKDDDSDSCIDAYFRRSGDPILLEHTSHAKVQFIHITTADSADSADATEPERAPKDQYVLSGHVVKKVENAAASVGPSFTKQSSVPPADDFDFDSSYGVTYGKEPTPDARPEKRRASPLAAESPKKARHDDTDYGTSDEETAYGPTQVPKPKSLFD